MELFTFRFDNLPELEQEAITRTYSCNLCHEKERIRVHIFPAPGAPDKKNNKRIIWLVFCDSCDMITRGTSEPTTEEDDEDDGI